MEGGTPTFFYNGLKRALTEVAPQWDSTAEFTWVLLDNSYTPSTGHSLWSEVMASECADSDYVQRAASGRQVTLISDTVYLKSDDVNFGSSVTIAARYLVLVEGAAGGLASGSNLIFYQDLNPQGSGNVATNSEAFIIKTPTNGWFTLSQS